MNHLVRDVSLLSGLSSMLFCMPVKGQEVGIVQACNTPNLITIEPSTDLATWVTITPDIQVEDGVQSFSFERNSSSRFFRVYADSIVFREIQGRPDADGTPRPEGSQRPLGPAGPKGPIGPAGPKGPQRERGDKGESSEIGVRGPQGLPGSQGTPGAQGPPGADGAAGLQGPTGPPGASASPHIGDVAIMGSLTVTIETPHRATKNVRILNGAIEAAGNIDSGGAIQAEEGIETAGRIAMTGGNGGQFSFGTGLSLFAEQNQRLRFAGPNGNTYGIENDFAIPIGSDEPSAIDLRRNTTVNADLNISGSASKPSGGSWDSSSDARLKEIGSQFAPGLEAIQAPEPFEYRYKKDNPLSLPSNRTYVGLVEQNELEASPSG